MIIANFHHINFFTRSFLGSQNQNTSPTSNSSFGSSSSRLSQPMCIQIIPPLQMCNIISQPLLYRIADKDGLVCSEVSLQHVTILHVFCQPFFVSMRQLILLYSLLFTFPKLFEIVTLIKYSLCIFYSINIIQT